MARRIVNTTIKNHKDTFRFELHQMSSTAADLDYVCEFDSEGFSISWANSSDINNEIVGSSCDFTMYMTEAQRSYIMAAAFSAKEQDLCVRIMKGSTPWWCGVVHTEEISEEIGDGTIRVSFTASDGLGMLSNYDYKNTDGSAYSGHDSVTNILWNALSKLPHTPLYALTGYEVLREYPIVRPVTDGGNSLFSMSAVDGNKYGTMDYLTADFKTFYRTSQTEEDKLFNSKVLSISKFRPNSFTSSANVVKDVMASLGASICFAEGRWNVYDKHSMVRQTSGNIDVINHYVEQSLDLDPDRNKMSIEDGVYEKAAFAELGTTSYNMQPAVEWNRGAARSGLYPLQGTIQEHVEAGSDLLYNNGIGYVSEKRWNRANAIGAVDMNQPLAKFGRVAGYDSVAAAITAGVDIRPFAKDEPWQWRGCAFPQPDESDHALRTMDGMFSLNDREREFSGISLPSGDDDGQVRIHCSGNANYSKHELPSSSHNSIGTLAIMKQRVEVTTSTGVKYRLSHPVRSLPYDSAGETADIDIQGANRYMLKTWSAAIGGSVYEWIPQTDSQFNDAWLDIPMGAHGPSLDAGTATKFMQTDYPLLDVYTPPLTIVKDGTDNTLDKEVNNGDRSMHVWRLDQMYDLPEGNFTITDFKLHQPKIEEWHSLSGPNVIYNSDGSAGALGTNYGTPTYATTRDESNFNTGGGNLPNALDYFQYSGLEIWFGDGTKEFDAMSTSFPSVINGKEVGNLTKTRLGASYLNTGSATHNRYKAGNYITPAEREDNIKFQLPTDANEDFENLGSAVCSGVAKVRGRTRQLLRGELFSPFDGNDDAHIVYPYTKLYCTGLDVITLELIPTSLSYSLDMSKQQFEGIIKYNSESAIATTDEVQEDNTRGPSRTPTFSKPDTSDISDFVTAESQTGGSGGTVVSGGGKFGDLFPIFIKRY